jgi:uncharacterized protein YjiS (DUF1127 family)
MNAFNLARADRAVGQSLKGLAGECIGQLVLVAGRLNPWRLFHRFQDEAQRNETIGELNLLSDHYLDDVGMKRRTDLRTDNLVKRLCMGG